MGTRPGPSEPSEEAIGPPDFGPCERNAAGEHRVYVEGQLGLAVPSPAEMLQAVAQELPVTSEGAPHSGGPEHG